ncbi:MAG TPA: tetratricopeptide repeat protein [Acetobacteraceae bacterium]|nr:tetratricopeptide repeat protein [Acetobacteraceae bacterium]
MGAEVPHQGGVYRFDRFTLDTVRGALLAAGGTEVALRPKAFSLLARLVENAGRLLDRDEIMRAIWPGVVVTEDSITQCVKEIRRALGDDDQRLLRTLPRRGFLFAAAVSREDATATVVVLPEAAAAPAASPLPAPDAPRPPSGRPVVEVLPFDNIGGDPEWGYFADGLTADLAIDLTRLQSLHVLRRRRGAEQPASRTADYVVSGAVRRAGGRVRVTAQLEDAATGVQLWADRFDRPLDDLFAVQEELAVSLAARLLSRVDQEGVRRALHRPPASQDVYDVFLRARDARFRGGAANTLLARELFERVIELDPGYAPAHAWLAQTVMRGFFYCWGEPRGLDALPVALGHARKAVTLEPDSPLCLSRLATVLLWSRRWDEALETGRAAVRANPASYVARQSWSEALTHAGPDPEEALRETRYFLELDPWHPPFHREHFGQALLVSGRAEEALAEMRKLVALLPDDGTAYNTLVAAAYETGQLEEARAGVREVLRIGPHWTQRTMDSRWVFRRPEDEERYRAAFRAAGLPEG